jgi:hypothetical protein
VAVTKLAAGELLCTNEFNKHTPAVALYDNDSQVMKALHCSASTDERVLHNT